MNPREEQEPAGDPSRSREALSALTDAHPDALDAALAGWARDDDARRAWSDYHLIGEVLRGGELGARGASGGALLQAVRAQLASEPVVLAPAPMPAPRRAAAPVVALRRHWGIAAAAAGVFMVAGVATLLQRADNDAQFAAQPAGAVGAGGAPLLASRAVAVQPVSAQAARPGQAQPLALASPAAAGSGAAALGEPQWRHVDGKVIRDARLDAYLRAHRGTGAVAGRFETVVLER